MSCVCGENNHLVHGKLRLVVLWINRVKLLDLSGNMNFFFLSLQVHFIELVNSQIQNLRIMTPECVQ